MFRFYYIRTRHTLEWLEQLLYRVGYASSHNQLRVIRDKTGRETHGTVCFLDELVYFKLVQENRTDFKIEPFECPHVWHPSSTGTETYSYKYCIPFPSNGMRTSTTERDKFYTQQIEMQLSPFIAHGLVPPDAYTITIPVVSRARSETKNIAFVEFHPTINKDTLAVIRYILDTSFWPYDRQSVFRCYWARVPKSS